MCVIDCRFFCRFRFHRQNRRMVVRVTRVPPPASSYLRPGPAKKRIKLRTLVESKLVNHCKLGLENWKHLPWHNNAYAGPNSLGKPIRSRRDIHENSKLPFFGDIFGLKSGSQLQKSSFPIKAKIGIIVPYQGENWCRQS